MCPRHQGSSPAELPRLAAWPNRIVELTELDPSELLAHPLNWRRHPDGQRTALRDVLERIGIVQGVIYNRTTRHLVDGHLRVEEALRRGIPRVPVVVVELSADEERLVLATFDPIGSLATPDRDALTELLASFEVGDGPLKALLAELAASAGVTIPTRIDPDAVLPLPDPPSTYVRLGQVWQAGPHRIGCGDATDPTFVARILDGARPSLLATDPPYGVELDLAARHGAASRSRRGAGHRRVGMAGDARPDWSAAFELVASLDVAYVWHPSLTAPAVFAGLERIGFEPVSEIIWAKSRWTVGRRWYHWMHESAIVARRTGARVRFLGGRAQGTVWEAPSPKVGGPGADPKEDHPSQKPVVLFERPIRNHLEAGGLAYDPFLGSGTAVIAAELTGRACYGVELDPQFAQLALERWAAVTGRRPVLLEG
jgi:DNA modification methylase